MGMEGWVRMGGWAVYDGVNEGLSGKAIGE